MNSKIKYILRYYVPCDPTYSEEVTARRGDELIAYCINNGIQSVMLYVDLNPNWYYMPDTVQHTEYYAELLHPLINKMREKSISYQLNYQNLFGSWDGGADLSDVNGWENWVDEKGMESKGCACCIGPKFREIAGKKLQIWASTKPDVMWIDDDIRFHNHRAPIREFWSGKAFAERVDFGCFCNQHIERFHREYGNTYTRQEIEEGILKGSIVRKQWMEFSGNIANEVTEWIEKTIHEVSPDTKVAVMTSNPDVHSVEGRNWKHFLKNLSGKEKPLLRPTFGPYMEGNPRDFFSSYLVYEQLKANIHSQYGSDVEFCPEVENTRFTRWSKSVAATEYQLLLGSFLGCKDITLSIFDLEGCVLEEEPEWAGMLKKMRPMLDILFKYGLWNWDSEGISLITAPDRIAENTREVTQMQQLARGRLWDGTLVKAGIPCKYITPDKITGCVGVALDAYTADLLHDEEIEYLLSQGVLLDAGAAQQLSARGFSEYIGLSVGKRMECIAGCEVLHTCRHQDGSVVRVPSRIDGWKWNDLILDGAEKISTLITPYGSEHVGFSRFKNKLGGTVYVYAANGSFGDGFYTNYRVGLLKRICQEILKEQIVQVNNGSYMLTVSKAYGENRAIMITNMSADTVNDLEITVPQTVNEVSLYKQDGTCIQSLVKEKVIKCTDLDLHMYESIICLNRN